MCVIQAQAASECMYVFVQCISLRLWVALNVHSYIEAVGSDMQIPIALAIADCAVQWELHEEPEARYNYVLPSLPTHKQQYLFLARGKKAVFLEHARSVIEGAMLEFTARIFSFSLKMLFEQGRNTQLRRQYIVISRLRLLMQLPLHCTICDC